MSILQNISSLNISSDILKSIIDKGYHTVHDVSCSEIGSSLNIEELTRIPETKTALQLLEDVASKKCVNSFIKSLDELLHGILKIGLITEFVGLPGSGRTQLCLHFSISAQIIENIPSGETVYISTNMKFSVSKLKEIAKNYIRQCEYFKTSTIDSILKRIHYVDVITLADLQILLNNFELFLEQQKT
ncbi:hypothetical protein WA026_001782 [Henosepilachna vigintioctopunctata]|uniref:DNA repair protein RAD51 homolog 3 n=1 Tax=Henosepilachna vigintioctopunctata TaxID=420089 RepID=A0AAW1UUD8_9CUCU